MKHLYRGISIETGKWVYGSLLEFEDGTTSIGIQIGISNELGQEPVIPDTVGLYTGLDDGSSIKIFEGDIVEFCYWWFDGNEAESILKGEIVYLPENISFGLRGVKNKEWIRHIGGEEGSCDTAPFATWNFAEADFHVLGSIHENKELLEVNNE